MSDQAFVRSSDYLASASPVTVPQETSGILGVLMPCYNEAPTLDTVLQRITAHPVVAEVIAVDDGSTDATWAILQRWAKQDPRVQVLRHGKNRGKGAAIRTALAAASAPVVVIQDADLEYDPADWPRLLQPILEGRAAVVYGSRFAAGARPCTPLWHRWQNWALTRAANHITGLRLTDVATCYKVFRREILLRFPLREERFGFCAEVTAKLARSGIPILEVPIQYRHRSRAEGKKLRWRDGWEALRCLWKYSRSP